MFKPRFVLTTVGLVVAAAGAACGYLLPVALYCSGAFTLQKFSQEAEETKGVMYAMAAHTTCQTNAVQFAPIWMAVVVVGLALVTIGLVWSLVVGGRSALARRNRSETSETPAMATQRQGRARSMPIWPLLLGLAIIGVYLPRVHSGRGTVLRRGLQAADVSCRRRHRQRNERKAVELL